MDKLQEGATCAQRVLAVPGQSEKLEDWRDTLATLPQGCPYAMALRGYLRRLDMIREVTTAEDIARLNSENLRVWKEFSLFAQCLLVTDAQNGDESPSLRRGKMGDVMVNSGFSYQQTSWMLKTAEQGDAGHPWAKSPAKLLDALQMRWEGRKLREIARMPGFCDNPAMHGTPDHDRVCIANLDRTLRRFRARIKKLQ